MRHFRAIDTEGTGYIPVETFWNEVRAPSPAASGGAYAPTLPIDSFAISSWAVVSWRMAMPRLARCCSLGGAGMTRPGCSRLTRG